MKNERIIIPKELNPQVPEDKPRKIDKFKLRLPTVPEKVREITQDGIENKKLMASMPTQSIFREFKMITSQFSQYKILDKRIQNTSWQRANLYKYNLDQGATLIPPSISTTYLASKIGFTDNEKVALREALKYCVMHSNDAFNSSLLGFEPDIEQYRLWFGEHDIPTLLRVAEGIYKINKILIDPMQIITFIDMRHQRARNGMPSSIQEPAPGLSTCYGKSCSDFVSEKYGPDPYTPAGLEVPKHLPATGMRILIGEHMLQPFHSPQDMALIIYHELTHKILGTIDKGFGSWSNGVRGIMPIFGPNMAQQVAKVHPQRTLMVADCWAYFVASFGAAPRMNF